MVVVPHINLGTFSSMALNVFLSLSYFSWHSHQVCLDLLQLSHRSWKLHSVTFNIFFLSLLFCSSETLFSALFSLSVNQSWALCSVVLLVSIFCGFWVFQNLHCSSLLHVVCLIKENLFRNCCWTLIILASLPCSSISAILTAVLMLTLSYRIYLLHLSHCFFLHSFVMDKVAAVSLW